MIFTLLVLQLMRHVYLRILAVHLRRYEYFLCTSKGIRNNNEKKSLAEQHSFRRKLRTLIKNERLHVHFSRKRMCTRMFFLFFSFDCDQKYVISGFSTCFLSVIWLKVYDNYTMAF